MNRTVLFVDDDPFVTASLKRRLYSEPYRILEATSGQQALDILASQPVDVIVSDERMPGMTGTELLTRVAELYPDTIRMMLTGLENLEEAARASEETRIWRFFTKPCHAVDLALSIRQVLHHKATLDENRRLSRTVAVQAALLERLEKEHPGIASVDRDEEGAVLIDGDALEEAGSSAGETMNHGEEHGLEPTGVSKSR